VVGKAELRAKAYEAEKAKPMDKKTKLVIFIVLVSIILVVGIFLIIKIFYIG
jgi:flagellar basal body-associated protein FliL